MITQLNENVLDKPLKGLNVGGDTLRDALSEQPTLLVFLRHFG